jgi:hypothetical protein
VAARSPFALDLTLRSSGMPPQRVTLAAGLPEKWNVLFLGDDDRLILLSGSR